MVQSPDCDVILPGSVAISAPATVDFELDGRHQVTVYNPGTQPNDVRILGGNRVNDPTYRFFLGTEMTGGAEDVAFAEPGRYLVICNITGHFTQGMWGWVVVQGD